MDWKYKHFDQEAVFNASPKSVLEAARSVVSASGEDLQDTPDGFVGRGFSGWSPTLATFHIASASNGTRLSVELLVQRATSLGYMLVDVGSFYNGQIDKWFTAIARRLGDPPEQTLLSKTTPDARQMRGCLVGLAVFFLVGAGLGLIASLLASLLSPQSPGMISLPFGLAASVLGLLAGALAYRWVRYPDSASSRFIRQHIQKSPGKER